MFSHLPEAIFWDVVKRTEEVKTCVALWCSDKELHARYSKDYFWKNMSYHHFNFSNNTFNIPIPWSDVYWWLYRNIKGCAYCNRVIAPPKDASCSYTKHNKQDDVLSVNGLNVFVCRRCKNTLGDNIVHASTLEQWQLSLVRRLRGNRHSQMFKNYFGENQLSKCHAYNMKCSGCLKNIKNVRCPHNQCGSCCNCKFHKSHYDQADIGDSIVSFDICTLKKAVMTCKDHNRKRKKSIIVHRY